jgi:ATP/maltotriose-dependent transcriptional regulator MalT
MLSSTFLGREPELQVLRRALELAKSGQGGVVLLEGMAGIGKTRLCQRIAGEAREHGLRVLWGRCHEEAGAPVYWPWRQLARELVASVGDAQIEHWLAGDLAQLRCVVPELGQVDGSAPAPDLASAAARFALYDALSHFWLRVAREQPLLLILDDLHWADASSLKLLVFLAHELQDQALLILASWRTGETAGAHAPDETVAELSRGAGFERLSLHGLSRDETALFLQRAVGRAPDALWLEALFERSGGHPRHLQQSLRQLAAPDGQALPLPSAAQSVRTLIEDSLQVAAQRRRSAWASDTAARSHLWLAQAHVALAHWLLRRQATDDRPRAREVFDALLDRCAQAGITGPGSRANAAIDTPPPSLPDPAPEAPTARELEVLRLLAFGRSNRDIGQVLAISPHTVANHIHHILEKTCSANRTEAVAYARQRGWVQA